MHPYLPNSPDNFRDQLRTNADARTSREQLDGLAALAVHDLSPVQIRNLAKAVLTATQSLTTDERDALGFVTAPVRILSEWTADHLVDSLVVAGLRRRVLFDVTFGSYGTIHQALMAPDTEEIQPRFVIFLLDIEKRAWSASISGSKGADQWAQQSLDEIEQLAALARQKWQATPIFHNFFNLGSTLFGNQEAAIDRGPGALIARLNAGLPQLARDGKLLLWDLQSLVLQGGRDSVLDLRLWRNAKMLISPTAAMRATDQLSALIGASLGRSKKVLVLDLDNTLWGGVVGDDGVNGLRLGQGSGEGESFTAFQRYAKSLRDRGIILAVASKNTHDVCVAAIQDHPEMVLTMDDFSCFRANWNNKADNLIEIAAHLNVGLDSLVFFDDSPAERDLIRQALPMVAVPEVPEDPTYYIDCLESARYFEAVSVSSDDMQRNAQYQANEQRNALMGEVRDLTEFLRSLEMTISIRRYNASDLVRITQLINKTNQFNLTTRRYTEDEVRLTGENPENILLSARVTDRFGDNGLVSVVIARPCEEGKGFLIDTWLMSCRVLARNIEHAIMKSLVQLAQQHGATYLIGWYSPTSKNQMVQAFYANQGFEPTEPHPAATPDVQWWRLELANYIEPSLVAKLENL